MTLKLHNTLTRKKEVFKPIDAKNVRMYVCGPTVYDYAHIGNFRPVVVFDVLFRLLRHIYGEKNVTYARNITDIDDRIMKRAAEDGVDISEITTKYTRIYNEDSAALKALPPDIEPKATETLPEMIAMMEKLITDGYAYAKDGHVLFHVPSMKNYGRLSKKNMDELIAGARVEVAPYKKDPCDFVLWKPSTDDQPGWDSPWGRGRPGWHLECSCMTEKHFGETFDIHGGGLDLIFPHHENEIAQSECAHGKPMANYWVHNGYLVLGGEKMSKSLGNIKTIHGLLEKFPGEALRLTLLSAHYRQPLDFSEEAVRNQYRRLNSWQQITFDRKNKKRIPVGKIPEKMLKALNDDLNAPKAIAVLEKETNLSNFLAGARFLGLINVPFLDWQRDERQKEATYHLKAEDIKTGKPTLSSPELKEILSPENIEKLIAERAEAKKAKNFSLADQIRDGLKVKGIILEDEPDGTTTWRRG